jgi:hypothetical protein
MPAKCTLASHSSRLMNQRRAGMLREGRRGHDPSPAARDRLNGLFSNIVGFLRVLQVFFVLFVESFVESMAAGSARSARASRTGRRARAGDAFPAALGVEQGQLALRLPAAACIAGGGLVGFFHRPQDIEFMAACFTNIFVYRHFPCSVESDPLRSGETVRDRVGVEILSHPGMVFPEEFISYIS